MSNSNKENENDKQTPDSEIITWGDLKRLEKSAEAGDLEAQNRLVEIEDLKNYEEYKGLKQQVIIDFQTSIHPKINSILSGLVDEDTLKDMKRMANLIMDTSKFKPKMERFAELVSKASELTVFQNDLSQVMGDMYRPRIEELLTSTIAQNDNIRKIMEDINRPLIKELQTAFTDNERFLHVSDRVADTYVMDYYPSAHERLIEQMAENNRLLAERNQLDREKLDREQNVREVGLTTNPKNNVRKPNAQIYQRAMIWRDLQGWMKLGNIIPTPKDCIAELKRKPAYKTKKISTKRMQNILNEGFEGKYKDILKNI